MLKRAIPFLLANFQETDTRAHQIGCLRLHVLIWYAYFLVMELAFINGFLIAYGIKLRHELSWSLFLSLSILLVLLFTLFVGFYALYSKKTRYFRWFSLRAKLVYYSLFIWAALNYFMVPTLRNFIFSAIWVFGAIIYVFEDNAIIRTMDFYRYRYCGLKDKDDA